MHILYIHQFFNNYRMPGSTRSFELARRLVQRGHEVSVLTADCSGRRRSKKWYVTIEEDMMVHWLPLAYDNSMPFRKRIRVFWSFARKAYKRAMQIDADLVFASSTPLTVALPARKLKEQKNLPVVFEVRDLWPEVPMAVGALKSKLERRFAARLEEKAYAAADEIIALSPGIREGIAGKGYPEERISMIPNGCDLDFFEVSAERSQELRQSYEWLGDRPLVTYAGMMGMINRVGYLVEIAEQMKQQNPEVRFMVVGEGAEKAKICRMAAEKGVLNENLFMVDAHPKQNIPLLLSIADVACSLFMNLEVMQANSANKFFDGLAAGKAMMINYEGWQAEMLKAHDAGIVIPPDDAPAAAQQLSELLSDGERLSLTKQNACALARKYDREEHGRQLAEVLERVYNNRSNVKGGE